MTAFFAPPTSRLPPACASSTQPGVHAGVTVPDVRQDAAVAWVQASAAALGACMALPFDIARERYAHAVRAGWMPRSLLASAQVGQTLAALEGLALGPWARRP